MPTRADRLDTKGWYPGSFAATRAVEPPQAPDSPLHTVTFLDLATRGYKARTSVQIDCEPLIWTRMEPDGAGGLVKRTWVREFGDAGTLYREIAPAPFVPTAYKPGSDGQTKAKGKRPRILPDVEPNEEWA